MTILDFLESISTDNKILQKLREETASKIRPRDPIIQEELDDFKTVEEEETEEIGDEILGYPKLPIRRPSATFLRLVHEADPFLLCEKRSDLACFTIYISNNMKLFDFGKDLKNSNTGSKRS